MMSLERASAKVSTITATMRLSTPKTSIIMAEVNTMPVHGCASMIGIAIKPQLSPATIVCQSVIDASKTDEKERAHRSQSDHSPRSTNSATYSLNTSTVIIAQMLIISSKRRKDQNSVLKQLPIIWISFLSSLKNGNLIITRRRRRSLHSRITRTRPRPPISKSTHSRTYSTTPMPTIKMSIFTQKSLKTFALTSKQRTESSTT
mmetsp:Transcript_63741/g.177269  ORF Transcript_63741/g.177269 Transcript_63741/m.177269 type:complete len:204 (+) Transcript_63741:935-1546(+)